MTYADIVVVYAPDMASPGDTVPVSVNVQNIYTATIWIAVTAVVDGVDINFTPANELVDPGWIQLFSGSFTMPNKNVTLTIWSWYFDGMDFIHDDTEIKTVSLPTPQITEFGIPSYIKA